jgi:hypothetical protein
MMGTWLEEARRQLEAVLDTFWNEVSEQGVLPLLRPVAPFNRPGFLAPAVTVSGLLTFILLSGVAVTALGALLLSLVAIYLLMVQVFGVSIELHPFGLR